MALDLPSWRLTRRPIERPEGRNTRVSMSANRSPLRYASHAAWQTFMICVLPVPLAPTSTLTPGDRSSASLEKAVKRSNSIRVNPTVKSSTKEGIPSNHVDPCCTAGLQVRAENAHPTWHGRSGTAESYRGLWRRARHGTTDRRTERTKTHGAQRSPGTRPAAVQGDRVVDTLSRMWNAEEDRGLVPEASNPCPLVVKFRERFLTEEETRKGVARHSYAFPSAGARGSAADDRAAAA